MKKHFHGISMITMQFPSKENQGVKQIVIHDLSLFDKNQKKYALPVCTINIEYLNYQDTLLEAELDREIAWLKSFNSKIYHGLQTI